MLQSASQVVYLASTLKAIEYLTQSRELMLEYMLRTNRNANQISTFEYQFDNDVKQIKERSITCFKQLHPEFFKSRVDFEDWESAMHYLEKNNAAVFSFWRESND